MNLFRDYIRECFIMVITDQEKKARYNPQPRFMMYHWHIPDPVYFSTALRATIQDLPKGGDDFSSVAYWYQSTPSGLAVPLPSPEEIARF